MSEAGRTWRIAQYGFTNGPISHHCMVNTGTSADDLVAYLNVLEQSLATEKARADSAEEERAIWHHVALLEQARAEQAEAQLAMARKALEEIRDAEPGAYEEWGALSDRMVHKAEEALAATLPATEGS